MSDTGRRHTGRQCWLRWAPLPSDDPPAAHIGYAIGRSIGSAVVRNRIRRRLRAILRELEASGELVPGLYLFGVVDARAAVGDYDELAADVGRLASWARQRARNHEE